MKKSGLLKQVMIAVFLSSAIVCFAQNNVLTAKHNPNPNQKGSRGSLQKKNNYAEASPNTGGTQTNAGQKGMWDIVFSWDVARTAEAGVETDGANIFTAVWSSNMFYKYSMTGTLLDSFTIPGVTGIRDLAFDGTYFYGGANSTVIYKMDFTAHTLVSTINCPTGTTVRNIAYDPVSGGLWVGGWDTDIICVSPTGTVLGTIPSANLNLTGMYGSAYDGWSSGGPYLWIFDQGSGSRAFFNQINLATKMPTGVVHNCTDISPTAMAGGAFCYKNGSVVTLGGLAQGEKIFAYDLTLPPVDAGVFQIISPSNNGSCSLTANESVTVEIKNYGSDTIFNIDVSYQINGGTVVTETVNDTILSGGTYSYTFSGTVDLSAFGNYVFNAYTTLAGDAGANNDNATKTVFSADATITIKITGDQYTDIDNSWKLFNKSTNTVVASGATGSLAINALNTIDVCVVSTECYKFVIYDAWGDGIFSPGGFEVLLNGVVVGSDFAFTGDSAKIDFIGTCAPYPEAEVTVVYTLGKLPIPSGAPHSIKAVVKNNGTALTDFKFTLDITGAETFTDTVTIANFAVGAVDTIVFTPFTPTVAGTNDVKVWVPADNDNTNNSSQYQQIVNTNTFAYADSAKVDPALSLGYGPDEGLMLAKYHLNGSKIVSGVNVYLSGNGSVGNTVYAVVVDVNGQIIGKSANHIITASDTGKLYNFTILSCLLLSDEDFYVGLAQTAGFGDYFPLGVQPEKTPRPDAYFAIFNLNGGAFNEFPDLGRWVIEAVVQDPLQYDLALANILPVTATNCTLTNSETIKINITNNGITAISNFDVSYTVDGGAAITETITNTVNSGSTLLYSFNTKADLSAIGIHNIKAWTTYSNDTYYLNDTATATALSADAKLTVNIQTDNYGSETTWQIANSTGAVIAAGGPYTDVSGGEFFTADVCVFSSECYTFTIFDAYGDGNCCAYGNGSYELLWNGISFGVIPGSFTTSAILASICQPSPNDVGAFSVDFGNGVPASFAPEGTVKNFGTAVQSFDATIVINPGGYSSTQNVATLAPGQTQQLTFTPDWNATAGTYTVTLFTSLAGDAHTVNDTIVKTVVITNVGRKAYCYVASDPTGSLPKGPAILDLDNPSTIISLADQSGTDFISGGTWIFNKWFGVEYGSNNLITIDTLNGTRTVIGVLDSALNGIAYDRTTSTLYGVSSTSLFTVDKATAKITRLGYGGVAGSVMINLACSPADGNLFALDIISDKLYSFNKTSGAATSIGTIGFDASYAQDMEFGPDTVCYLTAYNATSGKGELRTVNTATGSATLVGLLGNGAEITGFAIPDYYGAGINDYALNQNISIFPNPSRDIVSVICSDQIRKIRVMNVFGQIIQNYDVNNTVATLNLSALSNGIYYLRIETKSGVANRNIALQK